MATTTAGATMTQGHRKGQAQQAALLALLVRAAYERMVTPGDLASTMRWIELLIPRILTAQSRSAGLASVYLKGFHRLEAPGAPPLQLAEYAPTPREAIQTSLLVTSTTGKQGIVKKLEKISGLDIPPSVERAMIAKAEQEARDQAVGAALRHSTNGGRSQIVETAKLDKTLLGYTRVTKANPCYFCAVLASRGPVYAKDSFQYSDPFFSGLGPEKVHDTCGCSLEPTYREDGEWPGQAREFEALWKSATAGKSGQEAMNAFRAAYARR